ncbi:MAG TPA: sodium:solute symporter family protein [Tepidisphaeraceae bacterium]|jgi:Na+/proline symporter|nr:sodium:solute symporter family protein [Tepidisphaeraceae bacterium]
MMQWLPAIVIFVYLAVVLYIGVFAFRRGKTTGEDFFLASRSIGSIFFFLSLFATNMTAFAILGSSGMSYKIGIGVFGMMATSSALVIPLTLFFIGTRLWAVGKRFGHVTQVSFFRDRYDCSFIGTIIFLVTAAMLVPYLIISIDGGGTILQSLTNGKISYPIGGAIVALIVMATVFFGGMRGAVWVNVLQTILFIAFGIVAFWWIDRHMPGGFHGTVDSMAKSKLNAPLPHSTTPPSPFARPITLLTRERIPWQVFLSFMLIPLSSIMFPHMSMMCFTAKKVTAFKKTVVLYPLCIMAIWLPCVYLGALGQNVPKAQGRNNSVKEEVSAKSELLKVWLETGGKTAEPGKRAEPFLIGLNSALNEADAGARAVPAKLARNDPAAKAEEAAAATLSMQIESLLADVRSEKFVPDEKLDTMANARAKESVADEKFTTMSAVKRLNAMKSPTVQAAWSKVASYNSDFVLLEMLKEYVPEFLAGLLAAGIISAVMGSDCHQILGLSTMFTKDIFNFYAGRKGLSDRTVVNMGRSFIIIINGIAYIIALGRPPIFDLAVTYAFSGFAALAPMMVAALFWKRSTKWGLLACTLWVGACVAFMVYGEGLHHYKPGQVILHIGSFHILFMTEIGKLSFIGFSMVAPMTIGSILLVWLVSLITPPPSQATIDRYFSKGTRNAGTLAPGAV